MLYTNNDANVQEDVNDDELNIVDEDYDDDDTDDDSDLFDDDPFDDDAYEIGEDSETDDD